MDQQHAFGNINVSTFDGLLQQYPNVVPEKVAVLEEQRLNVIPKAVKEREPAFLTKPELVTLVDWKLAHGKFRPTLQKLVQENDEVSVKTTSIECFQLKSNPSANVPAEVRVKRMVDLFSKLKGVGPATATLLLSLHDPDNIPFFSDELYRWVFWDAPPTAKGAGWKREIKYTVKEYLQLYPKVQELKARLQAEAPGTSVGALDIEKVAYVLGKQAQALPAKKLAIGKGKKRKTPEASRDAGDAGDAREDEIPKMFRGEDQAAIAAWCRRFEVSLLGEEAVAQMDEEDANETAEEREAHTAWTESQACKDFVDSVENMFDPIKVSSKRRAEDDGAEGAAEKRQRTPLPQTSEGEA